MRKTYSFLFIQNKLNWHIYRILRGRTVSEKLPRILVFGTFLIHQLRLLGSHQHMQSGVLLTSFSVCRKDSLAEINLESTGVIKGCKILGGSKIGTHLQLCGRAHYRATRKKISEAERGWKNPLNALQEAIHYCFIKFCICCFPSGANSLCTTP